MIFISVGHYLVARSTTAGHVARISTPSYTFPGDYCIEFYYHMRGSNVGTLNVYKLSPNETLENATPVWTMSGNQGNEWRVASIEVSSAVHFQVIMYPLIGGQPPELPHRG